ncbi:MAG: GNAT family N-acetyltransferase [Casimicrobium sp.]
MKLIGPTFDRSTDCERVLRTLPKWFGIEEALRGYVEGSTRFPTFLAEDETRAIGFLTVREHFPQSWEVHCVAIDVSHRGSGVGRELHEHVAQWLRNHGAKTLQVKTLAATHPSPEYAQTREFYRALGYSPLEVFPTLWGERLPVLQLVKFIDRN